MGRHAVSSAANSSLRACTSTCSAPRRASPQRRAEPLAAPPFLYRYIAPLLATLRHSFFHSVFKQQYNVAQRQRSHHTYRHLCANARDGQAPQTLFAQANMREMHVTAALSTPRPPLDICLSSPPSNAYYIAIGLPKMPPARPSMVSSALEIPRAKLVGGCFLSCTLS